MKNLIKLITAITAIIFLFSINLKAQSKSTSPWRFGVGLEAGIPTGNANKVSDYEIGGTARLQFSTSKNVAITLTSGYYNMFGKSYITYAVSPALLGYVPATVKGRSVGIIPVKAGIKAYLAPRFYFLGEAGAGFEAHTSLAGQARDTKIILSPGLGYSNKKLDIALRYENFSGKSSSTLGDYGLVGLRIAYGFGL